MEVRHRNILFAPNRFCDFVVQIDSFLALISFVVGSWNGCSKNTQKAWWLGRGLLATMESTQVWLAAGLVWMQVEGFCNAQMWRILAISSTGLVMHFLEEQIE